MIFQSNNRQKCTLLENCSLILGLDVQRDVEAVAWILRFGVQVKVLEPEWLRAEVRGEAENVSRNN